MEQEKEVKAAAYLVEQSYANLLYISLRNTYTKAIFVYLLIAIYFATAEPLFVIPLPFVLRYGIYVVGLMGLSLIISAVSSIYNAKVRGRRLLVTLREDDIIWYDEKRDFTDIREWFYITRIAFTKNYMIVDTLDAPNYTQAVKRSTLTEEKENLIMDLAKANQVAVKAPKTINPNKEADEEF